MDSREGKVTWKTCQGQDNIARGMSPGQKVAVGRRALLISYIKK